MGNVYIYRIKIATRFRSDAYSDITFFRWSPDGQHFFFIAENKNQYLVIQDGQEHYRSFDFIGQIQWSDDSKQLAYFGIVGRGRSEARSIIMWNGIPIK